MHSRDVARAKESAVAAGLLVGLVVLAVGFRVHVDDVRAFERFESSLGRMERAAGELDCDPEGCDPRHVAAVRESLSELEQALHAASGPLAGPPRSVIDGFGALVAEWGNARSAAHPSLRVTARRARQLAEGWRGVRVSRERTASELLTLFVLLVLAASLCAGAATGLFVRLAVRRFRHEPAPRPAARRAALQHYPALVSLASSEAIASGDPSEAAAALVRCALDALRCDGAAVYGWNDERTRLLCLARVRHGARDGLAGPDIDPDAHPEWRAALDAGRVLAVADCRSDERTSGLVSRTFSDALPRATLDASIRIGSVQCGVLLVHSDEHHAWTAEERAFVAALADFMSMPYAVRDRIRSESTIAAGEKKYASLFESIADPVFIYDRETHRFLDCNEAVIRTYGWTRDELRTMTPFDLHPEEERSWVEKHIDVRNVESPTGYTHVTKTGLTREVEIVSEETEYEGRPAWISIVRDVSERNRAMRILRAQEEYLREILDAAPNPIFALDARDRISVANRAMGELCELEARDLIGRGRAWLERERPHAATLIGGGADAAAEDDDARTGQIVVRLPGGDARWYHVVRARMASRWKESHQVLCVATDITPHKSMEEELVRARESALDAARLKSRFLANVSHEIRTPLNAVIGMADLLSETDLDEKQRECLSIILNSGRSLLELMNDILDYSRIESGRLDLEEGAFDPRETVRAVTRLLRHRAVEKNLDLHEHVSDDLPERIVGDPVRLRKVLLSLVDNAIKFTPSGTVSVLADLGVDETGGERVVFRVRDTGIGIDPGQREGIFDAFSQADGSSTRRFGGSGLGLAISARIVRMMNGTIELRSEPGQGSEFSVHLPLVPAPDEGVPDASRSEEAAEAGRRDADLPRLRVLLAEDNAVNRRLAQALVSRLGHDVHAVEDGRQAVEAATRGPYDLVLMDLQMPEMDGLEATRAIRAHEAEHGGHLPVVALTAHAHDDDRERCIAAGMDDYISKPIETEALSRVVRNASRRFQRTRATDRVPVRT